MVLFPAPIYCNTWLESKKATPANQKALPVEHEVRILEHKAQRAVRPVRNGIGTHKPGKKAKGWGRAALQQQEFGPTTGVLPCVSLWV